MAEPNEATPLKSERGCDHWFCCRKLAPLEVPILQANRHMVLKSCMALCGFSVLLSVLGFTGGFASSESILAHLPWFVLRSPGHTTVAGVRHVCTTTGDGQHIHAAWLPGSRATQAAVQLTAALAMVQESPWFCRSWSDLDCGRTKFETECELCKFETIGICTSVAIGVVTYLAFANKTHARLSGKDSNHTKFMACFSALFGGTNFLLAILGYRRTCVLAAGPNPIVDAEDGLGLTFTLIATGLKIFMGLLHLALPVEVSEKEDV